MVDTVGTVGAVSAGGVAAAATPAPQGVATDATTAKVSALPPLSPVMTADPLSGTVITQYLNQQGDVTAQVPSTTAVAYLRLGLTASGEPASSSGSSVVA
jgi:hypothetical protein